MTRRDRRPLREFEYETLVELIGRYSKLPPLPRFALASRTGRRTARSGNQARQPFSVRRRLTVQQRQELVDAYASGTSSAQLAMDFAISKPSVLKLLDEAGVTRRVNTPTADQVAEAERLYINERWSLAKIAEHLGFEDTTIYRHLKQRGVPMRRPWERLQP